MKQGICSRCLDDENGLDEFDICSRCRAEEEAFEEQEGI